MGEKGKKGRGNNKQGRIKNQQNLSNSKKTLISKSEPQVGLPQSKAEQLDTTTQPTAEPVPEITSTILSQNESQPEVSLQKATFWEKLPHFDKRKVRVFLGGGILALFITLVTSSIQIGGATDIKAAHIFLFLAWLVVVISVFGSERLLEVSRKRTSITVLATAVIAAIVLYGIDLWIINKKAEIDKNAEIQRLATQPAPLTILTDSATQKTPDEQQARNEFLIESAKSLKNLNVFVKLNRDYMPQDLNHFRILFEITNDDYSPNLPRLIIGCRDYSQTIAKGGNNTVVECNIWSRNPNKKPTAIRNEVGLWSNGNYFGFDLLENKISPFKTVDDLNGKRLNVYVTESILGKISEIALIVNNYVIISESANQFLVNDEKPIVEWVLPLTKTERAIQWHQVYLKQTGALARASRQMGRMNDPMPWQLDFTLKTPTKHRDKSILE